MEELDRYNEAEYTANKYVLRCTGIMTMAIVVSAIANSVSKIITENVDYAKK